MGRRLTKADMLKAAQVFGRQGGNLRKATLTSKQRSDIASKAAAARWAKWRREHGKA
jgi:hypothetical protein